MGLFHSYSNLIKGGNTYLDLCHFKVLVDNQGWIEATYSNSILKARVKEFVLAPTASSEQSLDILSSNTNTSKETKKTQSTHDDPEFHTQSSKIQCSSLISANRSAPPPLKSSRMSSIDLPIANFSDASRSCCHLPEKTSCIQRKPNTKASSANVDNPIALNTLFYWICGQCTLANVFYKTKCAACGKYKNRLSTLSALLDVAHIATKNATVPEEAIGKIPSGDKPAIPTEIIAAILSPSNVHISAKNRSFNVGDIFYWICAQCTTRNDYRKFKCTTCLKKKTLLSPCSTLLKIADASAKLARTVEEAVNATDLIHRRAIPLPVYSNLLTCAAVIGTKNDQRRCLRAKAGGTIWCTLHSDPLHLENKSANEERSKHVVGADSSSTPSIIINTDLISSSSTVTKHKSSSQFSKIEISAFVKNVLDVFERKVTYSVSNKLSWSISSVEDAMFCQEKRPFPLGMIARRFFPGYGFHDGRIVNVRRSMFFDDETSVERPVFVYRTNYDDGDEEDLMHHEVTSLRQLYDVRNVMSTAPPAAQLPPNTIVELVKGGMVKILENYTPKTSINTTEGGMIRGLFSKNNCPWTRISIDVTELQLNVLRKQVTDFIETSDHAGKFNGIIKGNEDFSLRNGKKALDSNLHYQRNATPSPIFEWPGRSLSDPDERIVSSSPTHFDKSKDEASFMVSPVMWILPYEIDIDKAKESSDVGSNVLNGIDRNCTRSGVAEQKWDPANLSGHCKWDPFGNVVCEICGIDKDDHQILICDECQSGFHMYCVRPVIVNVPTNEWNCSRCSVGLDEETISFSDMIETLKDDLRSVVKFLHLPFQQPSEFYSLYGTELDLFAPTTHSSKRLSTIGTCRKKSTVKVGSLYFPWNVKKNHWTLPLPIPSSCLYVTSLTSMVASMKYCGMTSYIEELVYPNPSVQEDMNNASLDKVEPMSQNNMNIFKEFKHNLKKGILPPVKVVHDKNVGFTVEACINIPRHTLIIEYVGEVTTVERSGETSSDSLMVLLDTGNDKTSLIIDPTKQGNIARFLSGINNRSQFSCRKANIRTRRFELDGKCRVVLFTSKKISCGEKLHYDYNAGVKGKDVVEWAKNGFYDTSNFF